MRLPVSVFLAALAATGCARTAPSTTTAPPDVAFLTPYGPPTRPFSPAVRV
jgi:hypothetical protein